MNINRTINKFKIKIETKKDYAISLKEINVTSADRVTNGKDSRIVAEGCNINSNHPIFEREIDLLPTDCHIQIKIVDGSSTDTIWYVSKSEAQSNEYKRAKDQIYAHTGVLECDNFNGVLLLSHSVVGCIQSNQSRNIDIYFV